MSFAKEQGAPYELVAEVAAGGRLPVVNFAAGGIATPADAALMMKLGSEGVFVGSGIFRSGNPAKRAKAIVLATSYYNAVSYTHLGHFKQDWYYYVGFSKTLLNEAGDFTATADNYSLIEKKMCIRDRRRLLPVHGNEPDRDRRSR